MDKANSLFDLLQGYKIPEKNRKTERGELLEFFSKEIERTVKAMGIRLAHYSVQDLYGLKSAYTDRLNRNDKVTAQKYFWYITKVEKVS